MKRIFLLLLACLVLPVSGVLAQAKGRGYVGANFALEFEGKHVGFLRMVSGGSVVGVVTTRNGQEKQISGIRYEPITVEMNLNGALSLLEWMASISKGDKARRSGAVVITDGNFEVVSRLEFQNAVLTELSLSPLDAANGKDMLTVQATFAPERAQRISGKGTLKSDLGAKSKAFLASNFRLTLPGIDTSRVLAIQGLTFRAKPVSELPGGRRQTEVGSIEYNDIEISVGANGLEGFEKWFQESVIAGKNLKQNATIELLDQSLKQTIGTISLNRVGLYQIDHGTQEATSTSLPKVVVRCFLEGFSVQLNGK